VSDTPIALVTGATAGLGLATARGLAAAGMTTLLGYRDHQRGITAAAELAKEGLTAVHPIRIDVADDASVRDAMELIEQQHGGLDVLVNNAAVMASKHVTELAAADFLTEFETNFFGVVRTISAALPLLRASRVPRIVNVSSRGASFGLLTGPERHQYQSTLNLPYATSKAALNMLTLRYAEVFQNSPGYEHLKINAVHPGYVSSRMSNFLGTKSPDEGARASLRYAMLGPDGTTGGFFDEDGPVSW
jgi:NAD(P)-dependent dehydrogenase (short-subunit alcohol dehydrogenase family)